MCGRKTLTKDMLSIIEELSIDEWKTNNYAPSYNIAPTHSSPILMNTNDTNIIKMMQWGLVPHWSTRKSIGSKIINARIESLSEKLSFKNLLYTNRCVVVADGYYEWNHNQPYYIFDKSRNILPMAGLWSFWESSSSEIVYTYTIITTTAQKSISHIHHRMPVILNKKNINQWINCKIYNKRSIEQYLIPYKKNLSFHPVSTMVNSTNNNNRECIEKINDPQTLQLFQ